MIKKNNITRYLFPNFLNNKLEYQICRSYWEAKMKYLFDKNGISDYTPYLNTTFANGQEQYNGNPIINLHIKTRNKAIRIVQEEPETENVEISSWTNKIEIDNLPATELVICLELSPETELITFDLIEKWIVNDYSLTTIEKYIDFLLENIKANQNPELEEKEFV